MNNINDLNNKLRKAQKDIEDYQESCKHSDQIIRMNEKKEIRWFCSRCNKQTRVPSQEEVTKWLK